MVTGPAPAAIESRRHGKASYQQVLKGPAIVVATPEDVHLPKVMHCHALSGSFIGAGQHAKRRRVDIGVKRSRLGITRTTDVRAVRTALGSRLRTTPEYRPGCAVQLLEHDQVAMTPFGDMSVGVLRNLLNKGVGFEQDGFGVRGGVYSQMLQPNGAVQHHQQQEHPQLQLQHQQLQHQQLQHQQLQHQQIQHQQLQHQQLQHQQLQHQQLMLQQHRLSEIPSALSAPGVFRRGGESSDEDMCSDWSGVSRQERLSPQGSKCSTTGDGFDMQAKRARVENIIRSMNARTGEHGTTSPRENKRKQRLPQQQIESQLRELRELQVQQQQHDAEEEEMELGDCKQHLKNDERRRLRKQIEEMQQQLVRLHRRFSCAYESEEEECLKGSVDDTGVKKQSERKLDEEDDEYHGEECSDEHEHEDTPESKERDSDGEASRERTVKQLEPGQHEDFDVNEEEQEEAEKHEDTARPAERTGSSVRSSSTISEPGTIREENTGLQKLDDKEEPQEDEEDEDVHTPSRSELALALKHELARAVAHVVDVVVKTFTQDEKTSVSQTQQHGQKSQDKTRNNHQQQHLYHLHSYRHHLYSQPHVHKNHHYNHLQQEQHESHHHNHPQQEQQQNHHHPNKLFSAPPSQRLASNSHTHSSLGLEARGPLRFASSSVRAESVAGRSLHSYGEQTSLSPQAHAHYSLVSPGLSTDQTEALPLVVRKGTPPGTERMTGGSPLPYGSQGLPTSQTTTHGVGLGVPLGLSNHGAPLPQHHPLPIPQMAYLLHSSLAAAAAAAAGAAPGLPGMGSSCRDRIPLPKHSTPDMLRGRTKLQPTHHLQHSSTIPTYSRRSCTPPLAHGSTDCLSLALVKAEAAGEMSETAELNVYSAGVNIQDGLTPTHLKKAKLIFFFTRYPSSTMLKVYFPDVKFNRCITSQLIKWFSNFREFFYIQMEKFARQALADGTVSADDVVVTRDSELFRVLNLHYNKSNDFQVPGRFLEVAEITLREFFSAVQSGKDTDPSWKKSIYKVICKLDNDVPEVFRSPNCLQELLTD
uniref:prospero homeobox protein 1-like n=1 Tax=Myxine glutinosa TaxID=7769 RepID=UPI00358F0D79